MQVALGATFWSINALGELEPAKVDGMEEGNR
jgi:hypothetical protein